MVWTRGPESVEVSPLFVTGRLMEPQNKDFALALYNKLWENINNKDTRLWTFLSIYGAAVALAFGTGKLAGTELYASFVILVLTVWALFIVLNSTWWDHRNRLMVGGIEDKFPEAIRGVVPRSYKVIGVFSLDPLNYVSVVLLVIIAVAIYLETLWPFLELGTIKSWDQLLMLSVLLISFAWSSCAWVKAVEQRIDEYYLTIKELKMDEVAQVVVETAKPLPLAKHIESEIAEEDKKSRQLVRWRYHALLVVTIATILFDRACWPRAGGSALACRYDYNCGLGTDNCRMLLL